MREAEMRRSELGAEPASEGWFVVNVADAVGWTRHEGSVNAFFESEDHEFPQFGINIQVLDDGVPSALYHHESNQEAFLVLEGEPLVIVEDQERRLRKWDFVHCPPGAAHIFVGPGVILMVGTRAPDERVHYPVSEVAARHGASAVAPSDDADEAYPAAGWSRDWRQTRLPWPP